MDAKTFAELQLRNLSSVASTISAADVPKSLTAADRIRLVIQECRAEHQSELLLQLECIVHKLMQMREEG